MRPKVHKKLSMEVRGCSLAVPEEKSLFRRLVSEIQYCSAESENLLENFYRK